MEHFNKYKPIISEGMVCVLTITSGNNLIFFLSSHFRWKGIVTLGGDGTFYEVLNGIFARPDWQDILKQVPLGIIPAGSGNGLSR